MPDEATTLYRFYDPEWRLLYVGVSWNPHERFKAHAGDKAWWGYVSYIRVDHYATRDAALQAESDTIREERPPFNTVSQNRYVREILQASRTVHPPAAPGRVSPTSTRPALEAARRLLNETPGITGKELGQRLGVSAGHARRLLQKVRQSSGRGTKTARIRTLLEAEREALRDPRARAELIKRVAVQTKAVRATVRKVAGRIEAERASE